MSGLLCIVRSLHQTSEGTELNLLTLSAVDFFNHLNMLYGTITEFCTPEEVRDIVSAGAYVSDEEQHHISVRLCLQGLGMASNNPVFLV